MEIKMDRPPRTAMEVFKLLPEGTLCEVIESQLYMAPPPSDSHQKASVILLLQIGNYILENDLGEVRHAPYGVFLDAENAVEPDLIFLTKERLHLIQKDGIHGAPDIIVEILSPNNRKYDSITKRNLYEKFGVKEYWIVDPETKLATGYEWKEGKYYELGTSTATLPSKLLRQTFSF